MFRVLANLLHREVPIEWRILRWKIAEGDRVMIINGKARGQSGTVIDADPLRNTVRVGGCNLYFTRMKPPVDEKSQNDKAEDDSVKRRFFGIPRAVHYSNVLLMDPVKNTPTRIRWEKRGRKMVRVSTKSGSVIPFPNGTVGIARDQMSRIRKTYGSNVGEVVAEAKAPPHLITSAQDALAYTYDPERDSLAMDLIRASMEKYNYDTR